MIRFRLLAACGIFLIAGSLSAQNYDSLLVKILEDYEEMMSVRMDLDVEDSPGETWDIVTAAINQGFLRFTVDPRNEAGFIEGATFRIDLQSRVQYIVLSPGFINYYPDNPAAIFARLTREFKGAADFFLNPEEFYRSSQDPLTRFLFEMEALRVETLLVRDRLAPLGNPIGPYEQFLLDSLASDNLISAALFLERVSFPLAEGLQVARLQFEETGDVDALRNIVIGSGIQIILEREQIGAAINAKIYPAAVATYSWLEFTPGIISRIHNRKGDPKSFEEILELEPDYATVWNRLEALMELDSPAFKQVNRDTIKGFESS